MANRNSGGPGSLRMEAMSTQDGGLSICEQTRPRAPHADVAAQSIGMLGAEPDPRAAARFLRRCPELSKSTIGELLGEPSDFFLAVLAEFVRTFHFKGARRSLPCSCHGAGALCA